MNNQHPAHAFRAMQRLAALTKNFLAEGKVEQAKKCIALASSVFRNGSSEVKTAVSSVFLFSVSTFMELEKINTSSFLTPTLLNEYQKQTHTSGL